MQFFISTNSKKEGDECLFSSSNIHFDLTSIKNIGKIKEHIANNVEGKHGRSNIKKSFG